MFSGLAIGDERNGERIVQAKALIYCTLPQRLCEVQSVTRVARTSPSERMRVTFSSVDPHVAIAFGADRALLGWIQTRGFRDGIVSLESLTDFFRAFGLARGGREYRTFRERLRRLECLSLTLHLETPQEDARVYLHPVRATRMPRATSVLGPASPAPLVHSRGRYGFELNGDFHAYLRQNPVPLPLSLLRHFHNRPKAWDLAVFVLYRCFAARVPSVVPWADLLSQMSSEDHYPRRLKHSLAQILAEIRLVYPDFPVRFLPGFHGLHVEPWGVRGSSLRISEKDSRR
ncbi:MAG TPA: replication protein RepA [Thermoanaerobaculia bacterium]|nr:replication protein RepA [Thermoanaerobaculia bacterium]